MGRISISKRRRIRKVAKILISIIVVCGTCLVITTNIKGLKNIKNIFGSTAKGGDEGLAPDEEIEVSVRDSVQLKVDNSKSNVSYKSLDEKVVTVDNNGLIKPISKGVAKIKVKTGKKEKTIVVKVKPYTIFLDAGHGGDDWGATGKNKDGQTMCEKDITLNIVKACKKHLEGYDNKDIEVKMTRKDDTFIKVPDRSKIAKEYKADLCISFHLNFDERPGITGAEVYVSLNKFKKEFNEYSTILGNCILDKLEAKCNIKNGGVKTREDESVKNPLEYYEFNGQKIVADFYGLIRGPVNKNIPGIIIEHGYINTLSDLSKFDTPEEQDKVGSADAEGIMEYYNKALMRDKVIKEISL